jgi:hypothetical protein
MNIPISAIMIQKFEFLKDSGKLEALIFGNQLALVDCGVLLASVDSKFRNITLISYIFINNLAYQIKNTIFWKSFLTTIELRDVVQGLNTFLAVPSFLHEKPFGRLWNDRKEENAC